MLKNKCTNGRDTAQWVNLGKHGGFFPWGEVAGA